MVITKIQHSIALALFATTSLLLSTAGWARVLHGGESILVGQTLSSEDGRYFATLQSDGNFVVYQNYGHHRAVWSTRTGGRGAVRATMETNGDFALFDASNRVIWRTATNGPHRSFAVTEHGQAIVLSVVDWWTSKTGDPNHRQEHALIFPYGFNFEKGKIYTQGMYSFSFQDDGNVVVRRYGVPIWATYTYGATQAFVDHGLVVSDSTGVRFRMKGRNKVEPAPGTTLYNTQGSVAVFPDGNLVAYRASHVWSSPKDWYETH